MPHEANGEAPKPLYLWIAQGLFALQTVGLAIVALMMLSSAPVFTALALAGAAFFAAVVVGVQRRRPWARIASVVALAVLWLMLGVRYVLTDSPSVATPALSGLVMLLAVPILCGAEVRAYFRPRAPANS